VQFLELQMPCDLDLESGHAAYRRASVINLYLHTKFHWNRRNFFLDSSRSCETKTRTNLKNLARSNL